MSIDSQDAIDEAIDQLKDLLFEQFDGSIPKEIKTALDSVQHHANKLSAEVDSLESKWASAEGLAEDLQDDLRHMEKQCKEIEWGAAERLCQVLGGGIHEDDPDPYGLHGLSNEHRREAILYREQMRLWGD